jgi:hypothetical protein
VFVLVEVSDAGLAEGRHGRHGWRDGGMGTALKGTDGPCSCTRGVRRSRSAGRRGAILRTG